MGGSIDNNGNTRPGKADSVELGRNLLADWESAQPTNFFATDVNLQRSLEFHWGREDYARQASRLYSFGETMAQKVDGAVREANSIENLPRLNRFDVIGRRIENVIFYPQHHTAGRHIFGSGMLSVYKTRGSNLLAMALFYLSSQSGEAGHNCPIACPAGLIKLLQAVGDESQKTKYLPLLLSSAYEDLWQGAQFLTEVQGGSDVGANSMSATRLNAGDGSWLLNGEKWFCSNLTADLSLVTARVPGQGAGTRGLGLFLVPRYLERSQLNKVYIRRLKEKLGTRSMATGELEFRNALAYEVGSTQDGFKNVMTHVINTSRVYNAIAVSGAARRAYVTAASYAEYRNAFGQPIIHFPIVQDDLANMRAVVTAMLSGTLHIVKLLDDIELGSTNALAEGFLRMAINLNKYRSAELAREVILRGIEVLGGNGAIETFSILPQLLRDNVVYENWEGTHNVLLAQVQRDMRRYQVHDPFLEATASLLESLNYWKLKEQALTALVGVREELDEVLEMDELTAAIYFRPLMARLTDLYYTSCIAVEGEWEYAEKTDRTKLRIAELLFNRQAMRREPKDIAYYDDHVSRLCK
jgi:alkylation response protein AidB-like acyl-CoA dehydrogenase